MPASAYGLMKLIMWEGWRPAVSWHKRCALLSLTLTAYPGLTILVFAPPDLDLLRPVLAGVTSTIGLCLGIAWGGFWMMRAVEEMKVGRTVSRSWIDPHPAFGLLGAAGIFSLLGWLIAAYFRRDLIGSAGLILPGVLLFLAGLWGAFDLSIAMVIRRFNREFNETVEVSSGPGDKYSYRLRGSSL